MKTKLQIVRELVDYIQKIEADPDEVTTFDLMNLKVLLRDLSEGNFAPLHVSKETPPPEGWTGWERNTEYYEENADEIKEWSVYKVKLIQSETKIDLGQISIAEAIIQDIRQFGSSLGHRFAPTQSLPIDDDEILSIMWESNRFILDLGIRKSTTHSWTFTDFDRDSIIAGEFEYRDKLPHPLTKYLNQMLKDVVSADYRRMARRELLQ